MKSDKDIDDESPVLSLQQNDSKKLETKIGRIILSSALLRYEPIDLSTLSPFLPNEQMESKEYYTAYDKLKNIMVFIKRSVATPVYGSNGVNNHVIRELSILNALSKHENIITLLDCMKVEPYFYYVYEHMETNLWEYISHIQDPLRLDITQSYMFQIVRGLDHCHTRGVIHRDLHPKHILLSTDGKVKISNFLSARTLIPRSNKDLTDLIFLLPTGWFRAPEILLGCTRYDFSIDIWSLGVLFTFMLYTGILPNLQGDSEIDQLYRIFRVRGTPTEQSWPGVTALRQWSDTFPRWPKTSLKGLLRRERMSPEAHDLLDSLLTCDPAQRPTTAIVLGHMYFSTPVSREREAIAGLGVEGEMEDMQVEGRKESTQMTHRGHGVGLALEEEELVPLVDQRGEEEEEEETFLDGVLVEKEKEKETEKRGRRGKRKRKV